GPLGAVLGTPRATMPALAGNRAGMIVVAWAEPTGRIEAARWDGASWQPLPSPGTGSRPAVAVSPGGLFGVAWVDATGAIAGSRLVDGAWSRVAALPGHTVEGALAIAMPDDASIAAAFVDRGVEVR